MLAYSDSIYWSTYDISDSWIIILNNALTHFLFVKCPSIWVGEGLLHKSSQYGGMLLVEEYNFHPANQHQLPTFKLHKNATFKAIFPNYVQITGFTISYRHKDYDAMQSGNGCQHFRRTCRSSTSTKVCAYAVQTKQTWDFWCNKTASPNFAFLSQLHTVTYYSKKVHTQRGLKQTYYFINIK